jgi:CheY-like chemotaxis protein
LDGDPIRLAQVVANLLNNAAKYTDDHGQITLAIHRDGNWANISVRDSGRGIPSDMLPRVFDLFTQVDISNTRSQGGLGIGLTLVKSLVEMHGGSVEAKSNGPGLGSEFVVRLPLVNKPDSGERSENQSSAILSPRRVLVVDDNRDAAQSLGMLLRLLGTEVQVVYSGAEALQVVGKYLPDIVLLDIGMPGMDGYEVAKRIRQQSELRNVMLIALTGWGQEEDRHRSQLAGFDHHLIKPADVGALKTLFVSYDRRSDN